MKVDYRIKVQILSQDARIHDVSPVFTLLFLNKRITERNVYVSSSVDQLGNSPSAEQIIKIISIHIARNANDGI